jgi:hypothetical protein
MFVPLEASDYLASDNADSTPIPGLGWRLRRDEGVQRELDQSNQGVLLARSELMSSSCIGYVVSELCRIFEPERMLDGSTGNCPLSTRRLVWACVLTFTVS